MSVLQVAEENIRSFVIELSEEGKRYTAKYNNAFPQPPKILPEFVTYCAGLLRQFSDRCSQKFTAIDNFAGPDEGWKNGEQWLTFCEEQLGFLHDRLGDVLQPLVRDRAVKVHSETSSGKINYLKEARDQLHRERNEVLRKLKLDLNEKVAESRSRSAVKESERLQKEADRGEIKREKWKDRGWGFAAAVALALIGAGLTVAFREPPAKQSSCQSNSASASNTQAQTPKISGTPAPSAPPSAGPPHATQSVPATPSSARRP